MKDVDRRTFLGVAGIAALESACSTTVQAPGGEQASTASSSAIDVSELTITDAQEKFQSGEWNSEALTRAYLDRIASVDAGGSGLHSVIETNPDAMEIARTLDAERKAGKVRGALHGVPILLKDNIETADKMATSAGSLALEKHRAKLDSGVANRLRAAGAVILGKANLSEWANFRSTKSSSGWSARGGQCANPYALDRNPCGSSSGSGAATSANLCLVSIGTETDGSIVCPSSANGLVGIKPTVGLVSRAGIIPISHSQDTAGPMTRTVADAAILLGAISGGDPRDAATTEAGDPRDYAKFLDPQGLRGALIGVGRKFFGRDARVDKVMEESLAAMKSAGAELVDVDLSPGSEYGDDEYEVLLYEFKADLNAHLATVDPTLGATSLEALIAFNNKNAAREMPFFGQEIFEKAQEKGGLSDAAYKKARASCLKHSQSDGIDRVLQGKRKLDAIVAPTGGAAWLTDHINGDSFTGVSSSQPPAVAGYPAITVPAGFVRGLPVGITFMAGKWSEGPLIRLAFAFEQLTKARKAPTLAATLRA